MVMGVTLIAAFFIVVANIVVDVLYAVVDPPGEVGMTGRHSRRGQTPDDFEHEYEYDAFTERPRRAVAQGASGRHAAIQDGPGSARQTMVEDYFPTEASSSPALSLPAGTNAFLDVRDLRVHFQTEDGLVRSVDGVSFQVERGRTLGIVGESGSGKSVTSLSLLGLHQRPDKRGRGGARVSGEIWLDGEELVSASEERLEKLRGDKMAMIFQDPLSAMHPVLHGRRRRSPRPTGCTTRLEGRRARARDRDARPGRHPAAGAARRRLSAPVLRRHAAARDDRDGAGVRPAAADRRRADHRARRDRAGADPRPDEGPAAGVQQRAHPHHARPGRGGRDWPTTSW